MQISTNLIFREDSSFFKMFHLKQITFCSGAKKVKTKLRLKMYSNFASKNAESHFKTVVLEIEATTN